MGVGVCVDVFVRVLVRAGMYVLWALSGVLWCCSRCVSLECVWAFVCVRRRAIGSHYAILS
jgi:hypothetical protein